MTCARCLFLCQHRKRARSSLGRYHPGSEIVRRRGRGNTAQPDMEPSDRIIILHLFLWRPDISGRTYLQGQRFRRKPLLPGWGSTPFQRLCRRRDRLLCPKDRHLCRLPARTPRAIPQSFFKMRRGSLHVGLTTLVCEEAFRYFTRLCASNASVSVSNI